MTTTEKTLYWDCETSPNLGHIWDLWNQNIGLNQLMESGEMLCFSAVWADNPKKALFHSNWVDGHEGMIQALWALLNEADFVVTYNGKRYDTQWAQREFVELELTPPSPYRQIDLYAVVRSQFRFPSNKLAYVAERLLGQKKLATGGHELWVGVMNDDPKAQKKMQRYCVKDTRLLVPLHDRLRPWIPSTPSLAPFSEDNAALICIACGGSNLRREGYARTQTRTYQRYQCRTCGKWNRDTHCIPGTTTSITETPIS